MAQHGADVPARHGIVSALRHFLQTEAAGGIILIVVAVAALLVANSALGPAYEHALHVEMAGLSLSHWINDGLMAVFFLLVGLEIKREMADGQLASWSRRALPGIAAIGGMAVPALIYIGFNLASPGTMRGWAIPAATDIAFALGVLALLGSRIPASLKVFLTALAILDDLGAVVIIALFYTAEIHVPMLIGALLGLAVLACLNVLGVRRLWPYLLIGLVIWVLVLKSGIHATLAGVAVAWTIPGNEENGAEEASPLHRLEHALAPWVAYVIVPIFGFANAGVSFAGMSLATLADPVPLGVGLGLFLGKQIGVVGATWLAIRAGLARLPAQITWPQFYGVSILCGIGFTMSLFIGALAFPGNPALIDETRIGVLAGSFLSMIAGWTLLRLVSPPVPHPSLATRPDSTP